MPAPTRLSTRKNGLIRPSSSVQASASLVQLSSESCSCKSMCTPLAGRPRDVSRICVDMVLMILVGYLLSEKPLGGEQEEAFASLRLCGKLQPLCAPYRV